MAYIQRLQTTLKRRDRLFSTHPVLKDKHRDKDPDENPDQNSDEDSNAPFQLDHTDPTLINSLENLVLIKEHKKVRRMGKKIELEELTRTNLQDFAESEAVKELKEEAKRELEEMNRKWEELTKRELEEKAEQELKEQTERELEEQTKRELDKQTKRELEEQTKRQLDEQKESDYDKLIKRQLEELKEKMRSEQNRQLPDEPKKTKLKCAGFMSMKSEFVDQKTKGRTHCLIIEQRSNRPASEQGNKCNPSNGPKFGQQSNCTKLQERRNCPMFEQRVNCSTLEQRRNCPMLEYQNKHCRVNCPKCKQKSKCSMREEQRKCNSVKEQSNCPPKHQRRLLISKPKECKTEQIHGTYGASGPAIEHESGNMPNSNSTQISISSEQTNRSFDPFPHHSRSISRNKDNENRHYTRKNAENNKSGNIGGVQRYHSLKTKLDARDLFGNLVKVKDLRSDKAIDEDEESVDFEPVITDTNFTTPIEYKSYKSREKYGDSLSGGHACLSQRLRKPRMSIVSSNN